MKKILFIVLDGLGDDPIPQLDNKTPLEAAQTPFMDSLADQGMVGLAEVKFSGALPTSEEGHLCLFGYDPEDLAIRRGLFTARGGGIQIQPGDVALRGNFAYVKDGKAVDRRAGRISNTEKLIADLNQIQVSGAKLILKSAKDHRLGIVLRGENLSAEISDVDCWYSHLDDKIRQSKPIDNSPEGKKTAKILNQFIEKSHQLLKDHPINKQREVDGLPPANYIITRGASSLTDIQLFRDKYGLKAVCIAGKVLYKQVAELLGMDLISVPGADGTPETNLSGKFQAAVNALLTNDFVFLHIKATDSLAEDGRYIEKRDFIEQVDQKMQIIDHPDDLLVVITSDHSTCSLDKRHCKQPCPVLIWGGEKDEIKFFSEKMCQTGGLKKFPQLSLMEKILDFV